MKFVTSLVTELRVREKGQQVVDQLELPEKFGSKK